MSPSFSVPLETVAVVVCATCSVSAALNFFFSQRWARVVKLVKMFSFRSRDTESLAVASHGRLAPTTSSTSVSMLHRAVVSVPRVPRPHFFVK